MKRKMFGVMFTAALLFLVACTSQSSPSAEEGAQEERREAAPDSSYEVLAKQLRTPWSIDFEGETIYISERKGISFSSRVAH